MIKISDLKRGKKLCFDKIVRTAIDKSKMTIGIKPLGIELIEVYISNGENYGRIIIDNHGKNALPEIFLNYNDFIKICELFDKEINISLLDDKIKVSEGKTKLVCKTYAEGYNTTCNFKFNFENAVLLHTKDLLILETHLALQKFAIIEDKLISCDGNICVINKLKNNFGEKLLQYADGNNFPKENWYINPDYNVIISEDKRVAFTQRQATGSYPISVLQMAKQHLSNSFTCDAKSIIDKIEQCSLIYEAMNIKFGKDELHISSIGKGDIAYETTIPVKFEKPTTRTGFQFAIKYFKYFCNCVDDNGQIRILFDDNSNVHMFRSENEKYVILGMGIGN